MIQEHLRRIEKLLSAEYDISTLFKNTTDIGSSREFFIKNFLRSHISENIGIGSGEIIDSVQTSQKEQRQIDIILFDKSFPTLNIAGDLKTYLVESVSATIEVKSKIDEKELKNALNSIYDTKKLIKKSELESCINWHQEGIFSYIVGYDGLKLSTIKKHLDTYIATNSIPFTLGKTENERRGKSSPIVDLIIILGKGFIKYDNTPTTLIDDNERSSKPDSKWIIVEQTEDNLAVLFFELLKLFSTKTTTIFKPDVYFKLNPKKQIFVK